MVAYGYESSKMADSRVQTMMNEGEKLDISTAYTSLARKGATIVAFPTNYVAGRTVDAKSLTIEY